MSSDHIAIECEVNGTPVADHVLPRTLLSDWLRHDQGLTGTHVGCEHGVCGACTVIMDGVAVRSCLTLAVQADGATIETVESLGTAEHLSDLQQAMSEEHGLQCGFCTPGILMSVTAAHRANASREMVVDEVLSGHMCRCTGYQNIRTAINAYWSEQPVAGA